MINLKKIAVLACCLVLVACGGNGLTVKATFNNSLDLKEGTPVYFGDKVVGKVVDVSKLKEGTQVEISLNESVSSEINSNAAVVVNRLKQGAPIEIYSRDDSSANALQAGQEIQALDSMFQLGSWMVGDVIQLGSQSASDYVAAFQKYLNGRKFQGDKKILQQQLGSATQAAKGTIDAFGKEVTTVIEELNDPNGAAIKGVEQLGRELTPIVAELAKSGSEIMQQIEELTKGLQNATEGQEVGGNFLDTLLSTLKKLNEGLEQGIENGQKEATQ